MIIVPGFTGIPRILKHDVTIFGTESPEPYEIYVGPPNLWVNVGWDEILKLISGMSNQHFDATYARIGVGDSSTAAGATDTDLLASTNKAYAAMASGYPQGPASQRLTYKARFNTSEANFTWNEWVLRHSVSNIIWNRATFTGGTKSATNIWYLEITIGKA